MRSEKLEDCPKCGAWPTQDDYDRQQCGRCDYGKAPPGAQSNDDRMLIKAASEALDTMRFVEVFVTSRQRIKKPEGEGMYRDHISKLANALAGYNTPELSCRPDRGGQLQ